MVWVLNISEVISLKVVLPCGAIQNKKHPIFKMHALSHIRTEYDYIGVGQELSTAACQLLLQQAETVDTCFVLLVNPYSIHV